MKICALFSTLSSVGRGFLWEECLVCACQRPSLPLLTPYLVLLRGRCFFPRLKAWRTFRRLPRGCRRFLESASQREVSADFLDFFLLLLKVLFFSLSFSFSSFSGFFFFKGNFSFFSLSLSLSFSLSFSFLLFCLRLLCTLCLSGSLSFRVCGT